MPDKTRSNRQIAERDIEALYLGNLKTVEFDLNLPAKGVYGSAIFWESDQEKFLDASGKVHRPVYGMGNREVTLKGTFVYGDVRLEKRYHVTILEQENPHKESEIHNIDIPSFREQERSGGIREWAEAKVRILPGNEWYEAQEHMHRYLLQMEDDRMLYHFRKAAGMDTKGAESPDGWDSEECKLRGHTTGHYLSALALCFHVTGDEKIRTKALYMVRELKKCQEAFSHVEGIREGFLSGYSEEQFDLLEVCTPYPKIWAPYYTLHKIIAGLLDCHKYLGSEEALEIAEGMGMWTWRRLKRLPRTQLRKMWSMYIAGEFGGMNMVMAQLAGLTGKEEFIQCARLFDNEKLFAPLAKYQDMLGGMHANQHIPQILGALEIYKVTGEKRYLAIADAFWRTVTENRAYAPGGVGENEMFQGFGRIGSLLTANTQESCASYNMLKLTKELYQLRPDAGYMDYYERTLYNHILATPAGDDSGESTYFFPLGPGMKREFLRENSCCHGTGMESHFKYREGIYYRRGEDLYINLYIPSELLDEETGAYARVRCRSRKEQRYEIRVQGKGIRKLYLRKPEWALAADIRKDGEPLTDIAEEDGYAAVGGDFLGGEVLEVTYKPGFRLVRTPDEPHKTAVQYGPYILAALSEKKEFLQVSFNEGNIASKMQQEEAGEDAVRFRCEGVSWIPVCEVGNQSYHVYVTTVEPGGIPR